MLNKSCAYLYTLGNDIYIEKNSSANIYVFIVNNSNTRKMCEICSRLTIKSLERCSTVFIDFIPFYTSSRVSAVTVNK